MNARKHKWILIGLTLAVIAAVWAMGQYDYARLVAHKRPTFARWAAYPLDGGSAQYRGIGYTVTDMRQVQHMTTTGLLYRIGPTLDYWVPFLGRDATTNSVRPM